MKDITEATLTGMMKRVLLWCIVLPGISAITVSANSSWHWVTGSPMKALPLAVILTLAIETLGILRFGKIRDRLRTFVVVAFANIVSFVAPYIYSASRLLRFYGSGWLYPWERAFNNGPNYIIRFAYLLLTLCVEVPLVYFLLKNYSKNKKMFLLSIIIVNVVTTISVAVLERLLCRGKW